MKPVLVAALVLLCGVLELSHEMKSHRNLSIASPSPTPSKWPSPLPFEVIEVDQGKPKINRVNALATGIWLNDGIFFEWYSDFSIRGKDTTEYFTCPKGSRGVNATYMIGDIPVCIKPNSMKLVHAIKGSAHHWKPE